MRKKTYCKRQNRGFCVTQESIATSLTDQVALKAEKEKPKAAKMCGTAFAVRIHMFRYQTCKS